jgi:aminoglycoside 6'-N-acetyltransferase I
MRIVDLHAAAPALIAQASAVLYESFLGRSEDWQDPESARAEGTASLAPGQISRVAVDPSGTVMGWIGAAPLYRGRVWEVHPLVVSPARRRQGIGRSLVHDLERIVAERGGETLWLGSDDENGETSLADVDLYVDPAAAIRDFRKLRGDHPCEFYLRLGFRVVGVLPDANGVGKPDVFFAKRVRE